MPELDPVRVAHNTAALEAVKDQMENSLRVSATWPHNSDGPPMASKRVFQRVTDGQYVQVYGLYLPNENRLWFRYHVTGDRTEEMANQFLKESQRDSDEDIINAMSA